MSIPLFLPSPLPPVAPPLPSPVGTPTGLGGGGVPQGGGGVPLNPQFPFPQALYQDQIDLDSLRIPDITGGNPFLRNPIALPPDNEINDLRNKTIKALGGALGSALGLFGTPTAGDKNADDNAAKRRTSPTTPPRSTPDSLSKVPFKGGQDRNVIYAVYTGVLQKNTGSASENRLVEGFFQGFGAISNLKVINNIPLSDGRFFRQVQWFGIRGDGSRYFMGGATGIVPAANEPDADLIYFTVGRADNQPDTGGDPAAQGGNPNGAGNFQPTREIYYRGGIPKLGDATPNKKPTTEPDNRTVKERSLDQLSGKSPFPKDIAPVTRATPSTAPSTTPSTTPTITAPTTVITTSPTLFPSVNLPAITPAPALPPTVQPKTDPQAPPKPDTTRPDTKPSEPTLNQSQLLQSIQATATANNTLLQQLPFTLPPAFTANEPFNARQKVNAKEAVCDAAKPDGCVDNAVKRNTDNVTDNVNTKDAENKGLLAQLLASVKGFAAQLALILAKIKNLATSAIFQTGLNTLTLITTIHNAAMLSRDIGTTLVDAVGNGLSIFGLKLTNADTGATISLSEAIGQGTSQLLKGVLGVEAYTELTQRWATANRIYQSGMNVLSNVQSLLDSARSLNEVTGNNVGKIGNALRLNGLVRENEYPAMSQNNTQASTIMAKLEATQNAVGVISSITGEVLSVQEQVIEFNKNRTQFEKDLKEKPPKPPIENEPIKNSEAAKKTESLWAFSDFAITKAIEEEVDT